ncbi:unnamed protein product [Ceutorhynchus assimilis]|uniref:Cyclic nucleotide-binding domain-containing protein n=1 Tax=Ceutorhynchus assimilis TaxID=467358 RepID=A0A9N9MDD1_9CUCU|nr:unnamed protein product [Ceutorhynchus assimilis]
MYDYRGPKRLTFVDNLHLVKHRCTLPNVHISDVKTRLPPNASYIRQFCRWIHKSMIPALNLAISKRNFRNESQIKAEIRRQANHKNWFVIHPYSYMEVAREIYFICYCIWVIITSGPVLPSFEWVKTYRPQFDTESLEVCCLCPYPVFLTASILWIVSCFFSGYEERHKGKGTIELSMKKIAIRYCKSFFFIDLFVIIPCPLTDINLCLYLWVRGLIMYSRMYTFYQYFIRFTTDFKISQSLTHCIILVHIALVFTHVSTCFFYSMPVLINTGEPLSIDKMNYPKGIMYYSIYSFVQAHFWGLGGSTLDTENPMEEFVLIIVMIIGRLWGLYILASLLRMFTVSSVSESIYEQYVKHLKIFISQNDIPKEMEERLLEYYEYKFEKNYYNEKAIFTTMSLYVRQTISLFWARKVINKVKVFRFFPHSIISQIIAKCRVLVYLNNDFIARAGDVADNVYFISSGTVAVYNRDKHEMIHLRDGDEFGLTGLGSSKEAYFVSNFVAIETTELYVISVKEFKEIIHSRHDILAFFRKKLQERLKLWEKLEKHVTVAQRDNFLSELRHERILERPSAKTRYYD